MLKSVTPMIRARYAPASERVYADARHYVLRQRARRAARSAKSRGARCALSDAAYAPMRAARAMRARCAQRRAPCARCRVAERRHALSTIMPIRYYAMLRLLSAGRAYAICYYHAFSSMARRYAGATTSRRWRLRASAALFALRAPCCYYCYVMIFYATRCYARAAMIRR